jgi:molybdopterin synthase sulfur carrier subunit
VIVPLTFHIPGALREFTGGHSRVEIEASPATVGDALSALWTLYPGVRDRIATEQGQIREHINIFVGEEDIRYTGGLMSPVSAGSQISIVPAISGGSSPEPAWPRADTPPKPTPKNRIATQGQNPTLHRSQSY